MTSKFTVSGTSTTVSFSYVALTNQIQTIIGGAAEYLFAHGQGDHGSQEVPITFESLTNTQKLSLVDDHIKQVILDLANTQKSIKAQDAARAAEEATKHSL